MALRTAGLQGDDIDLVICATCTPDGMFPGSSAIIQDAIGARHAGASTLARRARASSAPSRWGAQFIDSGIYNRVLVVGSESTRASSTGPTAAPASCSAMAPAPCCERGDGMPAASVLKSGSGGHLLYARGPASRRRR